MKRNKKGYENHTENQTETTQNQKKKPLVRRSVLVTASSILAAVTIFGFASGALITKNDSLPNKDEINHNIMLLDPETCYMSAPGIILKNETRYVPNENTTSYVVLDKNITKEQKTAIESYIKELNYLFEYINPLYKFEVVTDYNFFTKLNANIIFVTNSDKIKNSDTFAATHNSKHIPFGNGTKTTFNKINLDIKDDYTHKDSYGTKCFAHEFGHVLGLNDCYNIKPYYLSVMNTGYLVPDTYFAYNDIILLGCKYKKLNNLNEAKDFIAFTCNYLGLDPESNMPKERHDTFFKSTLPPLPITDNLPTDKSPWEK